MSRTVLMVAYHFPPFRGSSGIQRTLRFVQYLPQFGWNPVVLAPHERAYPSCSPELLAEVPSIVPVKRSFALDIGKHVAIRGAYPVWLALPDRYNAWLLGAIPAGLSLIRKYRPQVIWTTYPVATAQIIGYVLHKLTGIPWVADLRDPILYEAWPEEPLLRRAHGWVEGLVARNASKVVCVTPSAVQLYQARYGEKNAEKVVLIPNGYDEMSFAGITRSAGRTGGPLRLVHSGLLEPCDRDPIAFFHALRALKDARTVSGDSLRVVLRGSGFEDRYQQQIQALGIGDIVSLEPLIPYREALQEMVDSDGLLLFQGPTCNRQIPAKAYEYIRAGTPILSISDPAGDTAQLLAEIPQCTHARFGDANDIAGVLASFVHRLPTERTSDYSANPASRFDRKAGTERLAALLDRAALAIA